MTICNFIKYTLCLAVTGLLLVACNGAVKQEEFKIAEDSLLKPPPPPSEDDFLCKYVDSAGAKLSFEGEFKTVEVVSYKSVPTFFRDGKQIRKYDEVVKDGRIIFTEFKERIILNKTQIDSLTKVVFNFKPKNNWRTVGDCYSPRHCIFFKNKDAKTIAYLELCFECHNFKTNRSELEINCNSQYDAWITFLKYCGIKEGFNI